MGISMECLLEIIDDFTDGVGEESTHYITVVNTATWGVSKAYAFFLILSELSFLRTFTGIFHVRFIPLIV